MTKTIYEKVKTDFGNEIIKRTDENGLVAWIPLDPANSDYQAYLATLASESQTPPTA